VFTEGEREITHAKLRVLFVLFFGVFFSLLSLHAIYYQYVRIILYVATILFSFFYLPSFLVLGALFGVFRFIFHGTVIHNRRFFFPRDPGLSIWDPQNALLPASATRHLAPGAEAHFSFPFCVNYVPIDTPSQILAVFTQIWRTRHCRDFITHFFSSVCKGLHEHEVETCK
jgi:hypothetical protein